MTITGMMANALRKNTTCPSGIVSPTWRTNADITANSSTETSLLEMARRRFMERSAVLGKGGKLAAAARCESDPFGIGMGRGTMEGGRHRRSATLPIHKCTAGNQGFTNRRGALEHRALGSRRGQ